MSDLFQWQNYTERRDSKKSPLLWFTPQMTTTFGNRPGWSASAILHCLLLAVSWIRTKANQAHKSTQMGCQPHKQRLNPATWLLRPGFLKKKKSVLTSWDTEVAMWEDLLESQREINRELPEKCQIFESSYPGYHTCEKPSRILQPLYWLIPIKWEALSRFNSKILEPHKSLS